MTPDFDRPIDRTGTDCEKWDERQTRFGRDDVFPLWVADMDFAAPEPVVDALMRRAAHPVYGYTHVHERVYDSLMDWLASQFGWRVGREQIMLAPGVVPSIHAAVQALTAPGDSVIIQTPVYAPFAEAVRLHGRIVLENPLLLDDVDGHLQYRMDVAGLERCAQQGAKLLLLCSPHNPVGRVWRREELQAVLEMARRYKLIVFSDEIHADLIYPEFRHIPLARLADAEHAVIVAVSPSKTFNLPGLGLSALIVADDGLRQRLAQAFGMLHWHAGNPFSLVAFEAAYRHGADWRDALMLYLRDSRDQVVQWITEHWPLIRPVVPQGSVLLWLDCRALGLDDVALNQLFVERYRLGLSPGIQFGAAGSGFMRLNLATARQPMMDALGRFAQVPL